MSELGRWDEGNSRGSLDMMWKVPLVSARKVFKRSVRDGEGASVPSHSVMTFESRRIDFVAMEGGLAGGEVVTDDHSSRHGKSVLTSNGIAAWRIFRDVTSAMTAGSVVGS